MATLQPDLKSRLAAIDERQLKFQAMHEQTQESIRQLAQQTQVSNAQVLAHVDQLAAKLAHVSLPPPGGTPARDRAAAMWHAQKAVRFGATWGLGVATPFILDWLAHVVLKLAGG